MSLRDAAPATELGWGPMPKPAAEALPVDGETERLQRLVDRAASFNVLLVSGAAEAGPVHGGGAGSVVGLACGAAVHRFGIELERPLGGSGVRALNACGEVAGRADVQLRILPHAWRALPDREPPPTPLDRSRSQRFALQRATFRFAGGDGFESFGTGRTFPVWESGRPKLLAVAVGELTHGLGRFAGLEGNYTFCGEITPGHGLLGHAIVRVQDPRGALVSTAPLPPLAAVADPDPDTTYLAFSARKGSGEEQVNRFSLWPDGQPRGVNISLWARRVTSGFAASAQEGFRCAPLAVGERIGLEIGCGRGSEPGADPVGTPLKPFLFEGVARYSFHDPSGRELGAVTTNVVEGRRLDMKLAEAPDQPAFRFGFFGPVVLGTGCFAGASGMFYGASGSIFNPPPGRQVVTHYYVARLHDPQGRFRLRSMGS